MNPYRNNESNKATYFKTLAAGKRQFYIEIEYKSVIEAIERASNIGRYSVPTQVQPYLARELSEILTRDGFKVEVDHGKLEISWG